MKSPSRPHRLPSLILLVILITALQASSPATSRVHQAASQVGEQDNSFTYLPLAPSEGDWAKLTEWTDWVFTGQQIYDLHVGPEEGRVWVVLVDSIHRSTDYGQTWQQLSTGLPCSPDSFAAPAEPDSELPLAIVSCGKIYASFDGGESWVLDGESDNPSEYSYYKVIATPSALYAASNTLPGQIFKRIATNQWEPVGEKLPVFFTSLAEYQTTLLVTGWSYSSEDAGFYKLAGTSWEPIYLPYYNTSTAILPSWTGEWYQPQGPSPELELSSTITVQTMLAVGDTLYVGTIGGRGVYQTQDLVNWIAGDIGLTQPYSHNIKYLAVGRSGRLFAAGNDGIFVSADQGVHWQNLDAGLPHSLTGYDILLDGVYGSKVLVVRESAGMQTLAGVFNNQGIKYLTITDQTLLQVPPPQAPPKAVLVVGPVDPPEHTSTLYYIQWSNDLATIMQNNGMQVVKVYWPDSTWENVRAAISGASIVVYKGHGYGLGEVPADPTDMYGSLHGFCRLGTQDMLFTTNRLAKNAIGFWFCCYCGGASSSDSTTVDEALARRRIEGYSSTMIQMGGIGYFSCVDEAAIIKDLFLYPDKTLGEIYRDHGGVADNIYNHVLFPELAVWFDGSQATTWGRAFVGDPNITARQILNP
jgi:hypothetical protein